MVPEGPAIDSVAPPVDWDPCPPVKSAPGFGDSLWMNVPPDISVCGLCCGILTSVPLSRMQILNG